jgi:hypothetical protein
MLVSANRRSITVVFHASDLYRKLTCLRQAHIGPLQELGLRRFIEIMQELDKRNRLVAKLCFVGHVK